MASLKLAQLFVALAFFSLAVAVKLPQNPDENPAPLEWWKEEVIYQVYPRSHQDTNGDGVGDLKGIENRLDHFVDLGIGAVWVSPIYKSPMKDFGYDISDFKDIEPQFGTMADFDSLSLAMKQRGIKLIMDFVPNHSSDEHEWFGKSIRKEGKYADYYVWKDAAGINETDGKPLPPNNWNSVFGGSAWEWNEDRGQFYLHQFTPGQPDLNFENHDVIVEMLSIMKFWMDKGVDGFRMDAVPHMFEDQKFLNEPLNPNRGPDTLPTDHSYLEHIYTYDLPGGYDVLAEMRSLVDIYSLTDGVERVMMVEATNPTLESLFKWYGTKERPIAHFPFCFEFINKVRPGFDAHAIAGVVDEWFCKMPAGNIPNWLMGNHDNHRVASRFGSKLVDAFNMLLLLLPGNAVTYYGEEIGMTDTEISYEDTVDPPACAAGPERYHLMSRDPERTPMQWNADDKNAGFSTADKTWLPMNENYKDGINVVDQRNASGLSHLKVYKETARLRHTDIWRYGSTETKAMKNGKVFGLARVYNNVGFVFIANYGEDQVTVDLADEFENIPASAKVHMTSVGYEPLSYYPNVVVRTDGLMVGANHSIVLLFPDDHVVPTVEPTTVTFPTTTTTTTTTTTPRTDPPVTDPDSTTDAGPITDPTTGQPPVTDPGSGEETEPPGGSGEETDPPGGGGNDNSGSIGVFSSVQTMSVLFISFVIHLQLRQ